MPSLDSGIFNCEWKGGWIKNGKSKARQELQNLNCRICHKLNLPHVACLIGLALDGYVIWLLGFLQSCRQEDKRIERSMLVDSRYTLETGLKLCSILIAVNKTKPNHGG